MNDHPYKVGELAPPDEMWDIVDEGDVTVLDIREEDEWVDLLLAASNGSYLSATALICDEHDQWEIFASTSRPTLEEARSVFEAEHGD